MYIKLIELLEKNGVKSYSVCECYTRQFRVTGSDFVADELARTDEIIVEIQGISTQETIKAKILGSKNGGSIDLFFVPGKAWERGLLCPVVNFLPEATCMSAGRNISASRIRWHSAIGAAPVGQLSIQEVLERCSGLRGGSQAHRLGPHRRRGPRPGPGGQFPHR
jgi:hypothetical protein